MSSWHLASSSIVAFPVPLRTTISLGALSGAAGAAVATVDEPEVDESYVFEWYVGFGDCSTLGMTGAVPRRRSGHLTPVTLHCR